MDTRSEIDMVSLLPPQELGPGLPPDSLATGMPHAIICHPAPARGTGVPALLPQLLRRRGARLQRVGGLEALLMG